MKDQTWRSSVLGRGNMSRGDAKAAAIAYCERLKCTGGECLPEDAAETLYIAVWASRAPAPVVKLLGKRAHVRALCGNEVR